jgi:hypothetical protein
VSSVGAPCRLAPWTAEGHRRLLAHLTLESEVGFNDELRAHGPPAFDQATRPPGYRHVDLGMNVHLHLTDGRTWRAGDESALLGTERLTP